MRTNENWGSVRGGAKRFIFIVGMLGLIVGLECVVSSPASAEIQNDLIGFAPNHVFEQAEAGENIDVMSGNMTLSIPIGPRFKLTDDFSWGVTLYYNSKVWEHDCLPNPDDPFTKHVCLGKLSDYDGGRNMALGFTWRPGYVYHNPLDYSYIYRVRLEDGSDHMFCAGNGYDYIMGQEPSQSTARCPPYTSVLTPGGGAELASVTVDGSHIVMWQYGPSNHRRWRARTSDGRTIDFDSVNNATTQNYAATATRVATSTQRPDGQPRAWVDYGVVDGVFTIKDSQCRTVTFPFDSFYNITSINFPGVSQPYKLKRRPITVLDPTDITDAEIPSELGARYHSEIYVLDYIEFPGVPERYQFDYTYRSNGVIMNDENGYPLSYGWMTRRTLPTGQVVDYNYDVYSSSPRRPYHTELTTKDMTVDSHPYHWDWNRFTTAPHEIGAPSQDIPRGTWTTYSGSNPHEVATHDAFHNLTLYRFHATLLNQAQVGPSNDCNNFGECKNTWSDGTMASMSVFAGPNPDFEHLVRRVEYEWDSDHEASPNDETHVRLQYRAPHYQGVSADGTVSPARPDYQVVPVNLRQVAETTYVPGVFSSGHNVTVRNSDWIGGVGCAEPQQKDEYVDGVFYRSTYTAISPVAGNCATHRYVRVTDALGHVASRVDRKFNCDGQLECEVRRNGTNHADQIGNCATGLNLGPGDVVTVNTYDQQYTRALLTTTTSGGDNTDARTISMGYLPYTCTYTDSSGQSVTAQSNTGYLITKNYGFNWKAVDRTVDFQRGLTVQTHDTAGNTTNYLWDDLSRLTRITPGSNPSAASPPEAATVIEYPSLHETRVKRGFSSDTPTDTDYTETDYLYDGLGRLKTTKRRTATGVIEVQQTEYDMAGRVSRKSEWTPDASTPVAWTTYDYTQFVDPETGTKFTDPLGRIHGVTTPDDLTPSTPTTETSYDGNATTVTVRDISGLSAGLDANVTSTTVYTKDPLGRLIGVGSPAGGASAEYTYDVGDDLVEARLTDPLNPTHVQVRRFDYDQLGRLRSATNPESGTVLYTSYDARGNLLGYTDAMQSAFTMVYDHADRLERRFQGVNLLVSNGYDDASSRLLLQTNYRIDNGASSLVSWSHFGYGAADSSDTCRPDGVGGYKGLNGRLAWQKTTFWPWGVDLETDFCEDALGIPTVIRYPDAANSDRTRTETLATYKNGYLTSLSDLGRWRPYINNVVYGIGGVPKEIDRLANKDVVDLDVRNRPSRIRLIGSTYTPTTGGDAVTCDAAQANPTAHPEFMGFTCGDADGSTSGAMLPTTLWDTGSYAYDMAGNVKGIGNEKYRYDPLNRLISGSVVNNGVPYDFGYNYDAFGNMTSQSRLTSGTTVQRTYTADWRSNRLMGQTLGSSTLGYVYDANGNVISEGPSVAGVLGGSRAYVYDSPGRLREVMDPSKGRIGSYDYDASGYRVRAEADGKEIFYLRDGSGQVLSEFQRPLGSTNPPIWNKDYVYAFGKSLALVQNDIPSEPQRPWPTKIDADADLSTRLRLNWLPVNDPDVLGYYIEKRWRKTSADTVDRVSGIELGATARSWDDGYTAYTASQCLKYTVRAMDTAGNLGDPGPELKVCPQMVDTVPAPTNVVATAGVQSVKLTWSLPQGADASRVLGYYVTGRGAGTANQNRINQELLSAAEFVDAPLPLNTNGYRYKVVTVDTSLRVSTPTNASPFPVSLQDTIAPGKITELMAEPAATAGQVIVSWRPGADLDVTSYTIYRSITQGVRGSQLGSPVPFVSGQDTYSIVDIAAVEGENNYYTVIASDTRNQSTPSDQVSSRPRRSTIASPLVLSAEFGVDDNGTTPTTSGLFAPEAEYDDTIYVKLRWPQDASSQFRIYRKAPEETLFRPLGEPAPCAIMTANNGGFECTFRDNTAIGSQYTYYVVRVSGLDESAAGVLVATTGFNKSQVSVRDLYVEDGRDDFSTRNSMARLATVHWSRVVQPGLVGYNVYRMCSFWGCSGTQLADTPIDEIDAFSCEPEWVRVNLAPVSPRQTRFGDGRVSGMPGCFLYAVRPVGPGGIEGKITKVSAANFRAFLVDPPEQWSSSAAGEIVSDDLTRDATCDIKLCSNNLSQLCPSAGECPTGPHPVECDSFGLCAVAPHSRCYDATDCSSGSCNDWHGSSCLGDDREFVPMTDPIDVALNRVESGINQRVHGNGEPTGAPPAPPVVSVTLKNKETFNGNAFNPTTLAQVSWAWGTGLPGGGVAAPSDLLGYHIEAAGSVAGPWQRLTRHPAAWWESRYTVQGVAFPADSPAAHTECLKYRVVAVDTEGNESPSSANAEVNESASCPATPPPPTNLRARTVASTAPTAYCTIQLDWDPASDATEYNVFSMVIDVNGMEPYFTQHLVPSGATTYQDPAFMTPLGGHPSLRAYYVTARSNGGQSPRSNLVFWDCGSTPDYASLRPSPDAFDTLAMVAPPEAQEQSACWISDGPSGSELASIQEPPPYGMPFTKPLIAPPLRLGSILDPPWEVYDLHTDHLGTVRAVTKTVPAGALLISRHDYFPFGEEITSQGDFNTHQFTGHERDSWTSVGGAPGRTLDYMLARYYEWGMGRLLSPDPSQANAKREDPASWNAYAYVQNNPMTFTDPTGMQVVLMNHRRTLKAALTHGMTAEEKKNIQLDKKTGTLTLKDKSVAGNSPQYKYLARAIKDDNTAHVQMISAGQPLAGPASNTQVTSGYVDKAGGGTTGLGPVTGGDSGRDVDVFVSSTGNSTGGVLGRDNQSKIPEPPWLVTQHEVLGEGLQGMEGPGPYPGSVAIGRENEIRCYMGMKGRGGDDHTP